MTAKIKLNHSGGNGVSLNAPASNPLQSDVAFKLPQADGSNNQFLKTDGSGNTSFADIPLQTLPYAFVFMDSQYFTSSTTLLGFHTSTADDRSSNVTIDRTNKRFTPQVAGVYQVQANLQLNHSGGVYTPNLFIYRNGSQYVASYNIINYGGGHYDSVFAQCMVTMNGSSDYVDMRATHNGGGNATMLTQSTFTMFRVGA